jgi:hypothetical protein
MRTVDWAALAIFAFEIPAFLVFSQYRANSIHTSEVVFEAVLAYFVTRLMIRPWARAAWLAGLLGLGGAGLACLGIVQFVGGTQQLSKIGLTDLVAFRSRLIHPIPEWVPGECFTVLLLALPFACAAAAYLWQNVRPQRPRNIGPPLVALLPALLILIALSLSLSRAIFWSTILFFFLVCILVAAYRVATPRTSSLVLVGALGGLLAVMVCETALYPGIFKAYSGNHISQARSTQGRLGIWSRSLELVRGQRWWGVGSSNAALSLISSADLDETTGFASRVFSLPIQVLLEKGLIGFAVYSTFLFLTGREFHRVMRSHVPRGKGRGRGPSENVRKAMQCCFAAGLVAVLFREITYSSLLEHTLTLALTLTLAALVCAGDPA